MKEYSWYLFDLDNTVLDFNNTSKIAFAETLVYCKIENRKDYYSIFQKINADYWHKYEKGLIDAGILRKGRFTDFLKEINIDFDASIISKKYFDFLVSNSFEIEGAIEIIKILSKNAKLAIVTNGLSDVQYKRIAKLNLDKCFKHVFISDEIGVSKPANAFFEHVHKTIKSPKKDEVLVLGDNPISDIQGATNFGYDTLFFNYNKINDKKINATYKIEEWNEFNLKS